MGLTRSEALKIMGLEEGCTNRDVREKFKKLALKWHPDKNIHNPDEAQKKFQAISAAYTKLVSTEDVYDEIPTSTLREMFAEIWGVHNRGRRQFEGSPHLFCDCDICQAQWEDIDMEDFIGSDSDPDDDYYYMDDTMYADDLLKDFADKLYRNFNSPGRAGKKTKGTWTSSGYRTQTVTAEEALRNADELLKAEEEEKRQAEKKKQKNKKKKESKKRRKAKQKDEDDGGNQKDETDKDTQVKGEEEEGVEDEGEKEPLVADVVSEEAEKKEEGKEKEDDKKGEAIKVVNGLREEEEEEEEPVFSEDEIDFTSAFVKHAKATAERTTSKSKETSAAETNDSHKKPKGQKPKPSDSGQHSSHQRSKSSSKLGTKYGTKYGTVYKGREGSSVVDSSSGVDINGTAPVVSGANGYDPASEEGDDLFPTDMSEAVFYEASIPKSRQVAGEGNRAAKNGKFELAVQKYSEAIKLYPFDHRYYGNRSFCYDYLHEYSKALVDANSALKIDSNWAKGYYRKGRALAGLQRYEDAVKAFSKALQLDPQYTDASEQLEAVQIEHLQSMGYSAEASKAALAEYGSVQAAMDAMATRKSGSGHKRHHPPPTSHPVLSHPPKEYTPVYNNSGFEIPPRMLSTLVPSQGCALWVGNVNSKSINQQVLTKLFQRHGQVASVRVLHDRRCAFVNYCRPESAALALKKLQGYHIGGSYLLLRYPDNNSKPPPMAATVQKSKKSGPVNGDECYFWRTTGCAYGPQCRFRHLPESKGVDAADMSSGSPSQ